MSWLTQLEEAARHSGAEAGFEPGLDSKALGTLESSLGVSLPPSLAALLTESDGVRSLLDVGEEEPVDTGWLIWPSRMILAENRRLRPACQSTNVKSLVFFASGDDVVFGASPDGQVFGWYEIERMLRPLSDSLEAFATGWVSGELTV